MMLVAISFDTEFNIHERNMLHRDHAKLIELEVFDGLGREPSTKLILFLADKDIIIALALIAYWKRKRSLRFGRMHRDD